MLNVLQFVKAIFFILYALNGLFSEAKFSIGKIRVAIELAEFFVNFGFRGFTNALESRSIECVIVVLNHE